MLLFESRPAARTISFFLAAMMVSAVLVGTGSRSVSASSEVSSTQGTSASGNYTSYSETDGEGGAGSDSGQQSSSQNCAMAQQGTPGSGLPSGYVVGQGYAEVEPGQGGLAVSLHLTGMNPATTFSLGASINGSARVVGNFTSTSDGESEFEASVPLAAGAYTVGLSVYDVSSAQAAFMVLSCTLASPAAVAPIAGGEGEPSSEAVNQQSLGEDEQRQIEKALMNSTIPFSIGLTPQGFDLSVTDHSFTVFVGKVDGRGIQVSVTAVNGTSPRVFLVNLTGSQTFNLATGTLLITYDGVKVAQASSLAAVLGVKPTSSPAFVVVGTGSSAQLLVSMPHFSSHVIEILRAAIQAATGLVELDWPALAVSLGVVTVLFTSLYARRTKVNL